MKRILWLGLLLSCGDKAGGGSEEESAATVAEICARIFQCGTWGWEDEATCNEGFLDSESHGTRCDQSSDYLICMDGCPELSCNDFEKCEGQCWDANC